MGETDEAILHIGDHLLVMAAGGSRANPPRSLTWGRRSDKLKGGLSPASASGPAGRRAKGAWSAGEGRAT